MYICLAIVVKTIWHSVSILANSYIAIRSDKGRELVRVVTSGEVKIKVWYGDTFKNKSHREHRPGLLQRGYRVHISWHATH